MVVQSLSYDKKLANHLIKGFKYYIIYIKTINLARNNIHGVF